MYFVLISSTIVIGAVIYWFFFHNSTPQPEITFSPNAGKKNGSSAKTIPKAAPRPKRVDKKKREPGSKPTVSFFYYSQMGTAEDFCNRLEEEAQGRGFETQVVDVEEFDHECLELEEFIVFCTATYGEGDPPDNAIEFHEWLMNENHPEDMLKGTKFAVFGLGNKTYELFNAMGRTVDSRLEELGAARVTTLGEGDDDANLEEDFVNWKVDFWEDVSKEFTLSAVDEHRPPPRRQTMKTFDKTHDSVKDLDVEIIRGSKAYEGKTVHFADVLVNRELHSSKSDRSCRHIEINIGDLKYHTGGHVAVFPKNSLNAVHRLSARLGADVDQIIAMYSIANDKTPLIGPCTLKTALREYYDLLSKPKKSLIKVLAAYATDEDEKKKLRRLASDDPKDADYFTDYVAKNERTILEILNDFKSVKPPLDHMLEALPRLNPRLYSISSSLCAKPSECHITAVVTQYKTPTNRQHDGVCTTWLADKDQIPQEGKPAPKIPVVTRDSEFKLPGPNTPIIMVGPGTGLAPFRGFLQRRMVQKLERNTPDMINVLYFGCRHPDIDYIYKEELEAYVEQDFLELHTAFSRAQDEKVYVQHLMQKEENAQRIWELIDKKASYVYICGDGKKMAAEVKQTLVDIAKKYGVLTEREAIEYIAKLGKQKKFLQDVW